MNKKLIIEYRLNDWAEAWEVIETGFFVRRRDWDYNISEFPNEGEDFPVIKDSELTDEECSAIQMSRDWRGSGGEYELVWKNNQFVWVECPNLYGYNKEDFEIKHVKVVPTRP